MATYNPPLDLFQRQVESIRSQTHANWICVVSDDDSAPARFAEMQRILDGDPRFVVSRSPGRLGYYHNFERALSMTPPSAAYVTLADQDDRWHPEKLETLLAALGDANLVYSDARIVDRDGRLLSNTYWSRRRNNYTNLASLLVANTVTGAASLFRRELLELALPFPPRHGSPTTTTGWRWSRWRAGESPTSTARSTTTSSIGAPPSATLARTRRGRGQRRGMGRLRRLVREPRSTCGGLARHLLPGGLPPAPVRDGARAPVRRPDERAKAARRPPARRQRALATGRWPGCGFGARGGWSGRNETLGAEGALLRGIAWRQSVGLIARRELPPTRFGGDASMPPLATEPGTGPVANHVGTRSG